MKTIQTKTKKSRPLWDHRLTLTQIHKYEYYYIKFNVEIRENPE